MELSTTEKRLVNRWQKGFPLEPRPFASLADEMGMSEDDILAMLESLKARGLITRLGAVVRPNTVAASSLVAMQVPDHRLEEVAGIVSACPEVNHNYEREDKLNLWFVVAASSAGELDRVLARIEAMTGLDTCKLPLKKAYHIDLGFSI